MLTTTIDAGGAMLHVHHRRGAPTVLLLHGLAGTADEWLPLINLLPADWGIIAPDLRAHGRSTRHPDELAIDAFVADAAAVVDRLTDGPVHVIGQSVGGVAATWFADAHPERVRTLTLIDAGVAPSIQSELDGLRNWLEVSDTGHDPETMIKALLALCETPRRDAWENLACPAAVVLAQHSFIDETDVATMTQLRPTATWLSIPASGHDIHLDQTLALRDVLVELI